MPRHHVSFVALCLILVEPVAAESFEYGKPEELKGVTRIFVSTGAELELRNNIVAIVQKELPTLEITDSEEDAEVVLIYGAKSREYYSSWANPDGKTTLQRRNAIDGSGLIVRITNEGKVRVLHDFKDTKTLIFERRPSANFARAFVKQYKLANGIPLGRPRQNLK